MDLDLAGYEMKACQFLILAAHALRLSADCQRLICWTGSEKPGTCSTLVALAKVIMISSSKEGCAAQSSSLLNHCNYRVTGITMCPVTRAQLMGHNSNAAQPLNSSHPGFPFPNLWLLSCLFDRVGRENKIPEWLMKGQLKQGCTVGLSCQGR